MDKEFFLNSSIPPPQLQYEDPFSSTIIPTWQSQDYDHFESALSSMVSSPSASNSVLSSDNFLMRELIGKLGNICNSNDLPNYINSTNCSTNNSCYSTPLSSPPKNSSRSMMMNENFPCLPAMMPSDPGFAERAARFSSFGSRSFNVRTSINHVGLSNVHKNGDFVSNLSGENGKLHRVFSTPLINERKQCGNLENGSNRKRKSIISKRKGKEIESHSQMPINSNKVAGNVDDSNAKRSRSDESNGEKLNTAAKTEERKGGDDDQKCPESPKKDYIHVRARRGQATDSHSLAERVRREKISERMKLLQDLVPGCNRVTGKALMLDEIINYVQSLQRQVEFLSMKLSTVNPTLELNMDNIFTKEVMKPNWCLPNPMYQTMVQTQYEEANQNPLQDSITTKGTTPSCSMDPFTTTFNHNNHVSLLPSIHGFSTSLHELPSLFEGGLQSVVEMRFGQKENGFQAQKTFHGTNPTQVKKEF